MDGLEGDKTGQVSVAMMPTVLRRCISPEPAVRVAYLIAQHENPLSAPLPSVYDLVLLGH
ncbi:hypothetical protein N7471_007413 [Penicillium samsonianum]|uniref:uncharacterized protein n=1 Tax=Penicillium samsonianum TaxID=1882272 RepID=UPI0025475081|nr:uncharacterized protein N7471_007413 [Penicillium samsonianum]KAJ6132198.1 hypothetical protein N7471_007413 [Penicillium samsonianum]